MPSSLATLEDACAAIAAGVQVLEPVEVPLASALGRVAAVAVTSVEPLPGFDNSAMDGYAVRAADTAGAPVTLPLSGEARAGRPAGQRLRAGEAMRISTGALLPDGADAVVRSELAQDGGRGAVELREWVPAGRDVRRAGEELAAGGLLVAAGTHLGPVELGALAAAGVRSLACRRTARVGIVVTGDELTRGGRTPARGAIRDSNRVMLEALVEARGGEVVHSAAAPDQPGLVTKAIVEALGVCDLVVTSGGMSVGPHDHVRSALREAGVRLDFSGVAIAPGRPAAFGLSAGGCPVLGLPGNPLSALVAFRLLVEPALDALAGGGRRVRTVRLPLVQALTRRPARIRACPCRIGRDGVTPLCAGGHGPTAALGADGLALVEPGKGAVAPGTDVEVALL